MPVSTLVKSSVTKCVGPFEVGAVLSIVEILSAIAPMPAMPFFGFVYRVSKGRESVYRVTIQVVTNLPLTSKQKFCFNMRSLY